MQQLDLMDSDLSIRRKHLSLNLQTTFLSAGEADRLLHQLIKTTAWQQPRLKVYGKWHLSPRLIQFYGDAHLEYRYSNMQQKPLAWTSILRDIKHRIEACSTKQYNSTLLNYYRDGQDTMGWHADDESVLGEQPVIASLSIGAARDIHFKPKNGGELIKLSLPSGSLLIMEGKTQAHWLHHIPKRARCKVPRINLTFRMIHSNIGN